MILHGYFRSTSSWRVRIALNLKGISYRDAFRHLRKKEHRTPDFLKINPQGLVPVLELDDSRILTQSLAICEYLDEIIEDPPLLPDNTYLRARARAFAQVIACDIHPVQNLRVLNRLRELGHDEETVTEWARDVIEMGLDAGEALLRPESESRYCFGDTPGLAELCLVPQLGNARRFNAELRWPRLLAIEALCRALPSFEAAAPENQSDADT